MIKNKIKLNVSIFYLPKHICDFWPAKVSVQQKTISLFPPHHFARIQITVKPALSGHRIKWTLSIKRTVAEAPKSISVIYFK